MKIGYDPAKRAVTLAERGLDFEDAAAVFAGLHATMEDARFDYGEARFITAGDGAGRVVVRVRTRRGDERRIISMRYGHGKEERRWRVHFGPGG